MNKKTSLTLGAMILCAICGVARADVPAEVKLIYPTSAKTTASTTSTDRRTAPPVSENDEVDVETPLGQVQSVLDALRRLEDKQETLTRNVERLRDIQPPCPVDRTDEVLERVDALRLPDLSGLATTTDVGGILEQVAGVRASLDDVVARAASLEEEVHAWRETIDKATAAAEKLATIKDSKATTWLCWAVIALLGAQIVVKTIAASASFLGQFVEALRAVRANQSTTTQLPPPSNQ